MQPPPVTEVAIANLCRTWSTQFARRFPDELGEAVEEYLEAILGGLPEDIEERIEVLDDHLNSLPDLWASFFRPMADGRTGIELARGAKKFKVPVLAAAVARMASARCTLADVVALDPATGIVTLRDVFDGTLYRLKPPPEMVRRSTRWLRVFGVLMDRGDGLWTFPSILYANEWTRNVEPDRLVKAVNRFLLRGGYPGGIDPAAPHAGLTRWAGIVYGVLVRLAEPSEEELEEESKLFYLVNSDGERLEPCEGLLRFAPDSLERFVSALRKAPDFVENDGDFSWIGPRRPLSPVEDEELASLTREGDSFFHLRANSPERFERFLARLLEELEGASATLPSRLSTRPWEETARCAVVESERTRRLVLATSIPSARTKKEALANLYQSILDQFWRALDVTVPALGGTPREVAQTPEGRAKVEAWLVEQERNGLPANLLQGRYLDLDPLRQALGLPTPLP